MDPVNGYNPGSLYQSNSAICGYDPNTLTVICVSSTNVLFRYYPATNTYTQLSTNSPVPYAAFGVIDPKRNLFIFMGVDYQSTTPHVVAVDISLRAATLRRKIGVHLKSPGATPCGPGPAIRDWYTIPCWTV